jgi:hypothetical protein
MHICGGDKSKEMNLVQPLKYMDTAVELFENMQQHCSARSHRGVYLFQQMTTQQSRKYDVMLRIWVYLSFTAISTAKRTKSAGLGKAALQAKDDRHPPAPVADVTRGRLPQTAGLV